MMSTINYLEEIRIKSHAKKVKACQISKTIIALYYCKLSANSLAMTMQFLQMSIYEILTLLYDKILTNF